MSARRTILSAIAGKQYRAKEVGSGYEYSIFGVLAFHNKLTEISEPMTPVKFFSKSTRVSQPRSAVVTSKI